jgi:hypothetical protein
MDTEHENTAADAHMQVAGKLRQAEWSVRKALNDIQDISRGLKETIIDENNPSYNEAAGKKMPSESDWSLPVF